MSVEEMIMKAKPFTGKWCSRKTANKMNDIFQSTTVPDRTALEKESKELIELVVKRRKARSLGQ